ncbi:sugar O-acetyltransferase [Ferrimonas balearica]|uniref:sugar O-acetyltransferase n=1 Tax=Ferrimonas balearica TaxID=44012 RepID=UPI001C9935D5|nr:sugar O-acetyltransferase [Ferrimonas balearica]MBY5922230.1 sugar O-acetyltransferase [Ferrimonas balearica]MBY5994430.1 sugar O-acetyltransferase [Ferrimonas balearica]
MTEFEKMMNGQPFNGAAEELSAIRDRAFELVQQINQSRRFGPTQSLFAELFGALGEGSLIRPPFQCEFGQTVRIGRNTFINTGVVMLDGAELTLGDNVMVGPSVQFYTASHSLNHLERRNWETHCRPIRVEDDVWIGGNAVINQGVTIGARSVVAANSVVNQDVPPDCLVGGTPARILKRLAKSC